ncbi:MAG: TolC family protein, partial [Novosphingobium sp.]
MAVGTSLPADWWRLYNEPALDSLIEDALHANTDLRQAVARIDRARAALRGARSDRTPQTSLNASSGYGRTPQGQAGTDSNGALFGIGAQVTYELD